MCWVTVHGEFTSYINKLNCILLQIICFGPRAIHDRDCAIRISTAYIMTNTGHIHSFVDVIKYLVVKVVNGLHN